MKCDTLQIANLLHELATSATDEVSLRHPMTFGEVIGRSHVEELATAIENVFTRIELGLVWRGDNIIGREWCGNFEGRSIRGVTVARRSDNHVGIDIYLSMFPALLRQALRKKADGLIEAALWLLPSEIDTTPPAIPVDEVLDAKLPFSLAPEPQFTSPVACKPICGAADFIRVCGHSVAVYGARTSEAHLTSGATTLSLWNGSVSGLPLEVANIIYWNASQCVKAMAMAMRPWPVVELFQARMKARTLSFLDASYFELGNEVDFSQN